MRVFLSYQYREREQWITSLVVPMLQCLGVTIVHGQDLAGGPLNEEIKGRIQSADALIAFLTRRDRAPDGRWSASRFVSQEMTTAIAFEKALIPVLEDGVEEPQAFQRDYPFLVYREDRRAEFLVSLVERVRHWVAGEIKIRLLPDDLYDDLRTELESHSARCSYEIEHEGQIERQGSARIFFEGGGLFTKLVGFPPGRSVRVRVQGARNVAWISPFERHATPFGQIALARQP
jgi:hypothetical protein